jgi:hypothetical protein
MNNPALPLDGHPANPDSAPASEVGAEKFGKENVMSACST